jgi:hypothetical protein
MTASVSATTVGTGAFASALLDPDIPIPDGLTGPQGGPVPRRYGVYRNNVVVGLMEALASTFPALRAIMGEENFGRVTRNFVAIHPPRSPMMQAYGDTLPNFLEGFAPLRSAPFLADVARVELAFLRAWHAADAPALSPGELAEVPADHVAGLTFVPHPAAWLFASRHPVFDLFAWRNGRPDAGADLELAQCVLVTRPELEVEITRLSSSQHGFLASLSDGVAFGEAAESALTEDPQFDLAGTLALALGAGVFVSNRT